MRLISLNTGGPRQVRVNGEQVRTSIWKTPREGRLHVATLNIDGDAQSDLTVHGGRYKAVYCYPSEHYAYWREQLPGMDLPWGIFGENLTTEGLLETDVCIGDRMRIGTAEFQVTQPRQPCFKLGIRFGRADMVRRFLDSGRSGFYVSVVREGDVARGDEIQIVERQTNGMSVSDIFALYLDDEGKEEELRRAAAVAALSPSWQDHFRKRLMMLAMAACLLAGPAQAQPTAPPDAYSDVMFLPGVQYGGPLRISGGLAVFVPVGEVRTDFREGVVVEASGGQGGVRVSAGLARFLEAFGLDSRAVLTRTWSSPLNASADSTYGGLEAGLSIAYVRVSVGVGHRIAGPSGPDATIVTWGAGVQLPHYFKRR